MTEVLFYHLQNMTLESVLPPLLEKSLERGWRVVVQSTSQERAETLDAHLWTYSDDSFLPHASSRVADAQDQPIVLSIEEGNPNRANVRFLVDNAALPADCDSYERVVLVFNGDDPDAVSVKQIASGLAEPLGLEVVDGEIYVLQKQELTHLIDHDGDEHGNNKGDLNMLKEAESMSQEWNGPPGLYAMWQPKVAGKGKGGKTWYGGKGHGGKDGGQGWQQPQQWSGGKGFKGKGNGAKG